MEKESALEAQQLDFDRKRTALETKHSEATDWLFRVTCACALVQGVHPTGARAKPVCARAFLVHAAPALYASYVFQHPHGHG
jgi:hypothetical protein